MDDKLVILLGDLRSPQHNLPAKEGRSSALRPLSSHIQLLVATLLAALLLLGRRQLPYVSGVADMNDNPVQILADCTLHNDIGSIGGRRHSM